MNYIKQYTDFLRKILAIKKPVVAVIDCSNGATGPILEDLFRDQKKVQTHIINSNPDPNFSAHGPDPMESGALDDAAKCVLKTNADFGVVFDGDGDRAIFLDNNGLRVDPIDVFYFLYPLFTPPYVIDQKALVKFTSPKLPAIESKTGTFFIKKTMRDNNASFGAERSGHFYFKDFYFSDSCILTAIFMINKVSYIKEDGGTLNTEINKLPKFCRPEEENFKVMDIESVLRKFKEYFSEKKDFETYFLDGVSVIGKNFAFNVRPSNTEPLIRLNIVAKTKEALSDGNKLVCSLIE
jgi:phosphomannomutase